MLHHPFLPRAEIVDMLQPGQINNTQVEAAFQSFASILAAADARRKQRNTVRGFCFVAVQHMQLAGHSSGSCHPALSLWFAHCHT
jgi:hypothetical protein